MSSFIVIGTHKKLEWLVDGIKGCRPLNHKVSTKISTGKVVERDNSRYYVYPTRISNNMDIYNLNEGLRNHIANFKMNNYITGLLNIFLLENPFSEDEDNDLDLWLSEIEKVFDWDNNLHFYRILFTYDLEEPNNVTKHVPAEILKRYFERFNTLSFHNSMHVMLVGNCNINGAAVSQNKTEHDFKLPRIIADFMMLLSSMNTNYNVFNAITAYNMNCFALGYAESMYYFPDVKEYYEHADMRSLYIKILEDKDEGEKIEDDKDALNVENYPIGLYARKTRLEKYADISFGEDIYADQYKESADYKIEECLNKLKEAICQSRTNDPDSPKFENRKDIYNQSRGLKRGKERDKYISSAEENYKKLVAYACGNNFREYVEKNLHATPHPPKKKINFWKRLWQMIVKWLNLGKKERPIETPHLEKLTDVIDVLHNQHGLKEIYKEFLKNIKIIENKQKEEDKFCNNFRLKEHIQHYYHLIDLGKLKQYQKDCFESRYQQLKTKRNNGKDKSFKHLEELMREETKVYVKQFEYINWSTPSPTFLADTSNLNLADICKNLYCKSAPFVHYNITTSQPTTNITISLYSDMNCFANKFNAIKANVTNGDCISAYQSAHIASKICMFQFLPLNNEELDAIIKECDENDVQMITTEEKQDVHST